MISEPAPSWSGTCAQCRVCGVPAMFDREVITTIEQARAIEHTWRCERHKARDACAIEGCNRTREQKGGSVSVDMWICAVHWRMYVPPRSKYRRHYRALFKRAEKLGLSPKQAWPPKLERQFWRYWAFLVKRARRMSTEGSIDIAEIHKVMGWEMPG